MTSHFFSFKTFFPLYDLVLCCIKILLLILLNKIDLRRNPPEMVKALIKSGFDGSVHNPHSKTDEALQDLICFGSTEVNIDSVTYHNSIGLSGQTYFQTIRIINKWKF